MSQNGASTAVATQEYEDFVPSSELAPQQDTDTLCVYVPGFSKEQMTVQLARRVILKISGQRQVGQKRYQRFQMEFPVPENCDKRKISAKLQNGILYVKRPKLPASAERTDTILQAEDAPMPKKPTSEPQAQKNAERTAAKEESNKTGPKTSEQTEAKSLQQKSTTSEDGDTSSFSKPDDSMKDKELQKDKAAGDISLPKKPASEPPDQKKAEEKAIRETTTSKFELTKQGVKDESNKTRPITSDQTEAKSLQLKSETLEDGETSSFSKPDGDASRPKKPASEPQEQIAEEQAILEKTTSTDEIKKWDKAENDTFEQTQAESIPEKSTSQKYRTNTSEDGKTSSGNNPDEVINDTIMGTASNFFAKLKTPNKVINMTLVALLILGIGSYVMNAMKSSKKAKK